MGKFLDFSEAAGAGLVEDRSKAVEIILWEGGLAAAEMHDGETHGGGSCHVCSNNFGQSVYTKWIELDWKDVLYVEKRLVCI